MKLSTTLIFSLLFAVVAGFYIFMKPSPMEFEQKSASVPQAASVGSSVEKKEIGTKSKSEEENSRPVPLFDLSPSDSLAWIQIQNLDKKEALTIIPQGKIWYLKYPVMYPVNQESMKGMLKMLFSAVKIREFTPDKNWEDYGLLRPSLKIGVQTQEHPARRYLSLGSVSALGESLIYARWDDEKTYFLLDAEFKHVFDRSVYTLREKRIFRIPVVSISKMEFQIGSTLYEIVKRKDKWFWAKPESLQTMSVNEVSIAMLFSQMQDLFIKDFLDSEQGKQDLSFFKSGYSVKISGAQGETETFYLGQEASKRDAFYGKRDNEDVLFLVSRSNARGVFELITAMAKELTTVS